ncbi:MAG: ABC transporter ATP-binding protein [Planctomycetota bacterium]|nr:ABC transporter ATP-binding protein [Planctomycetota bacterium]
MISVSHLTRTFGSLRALDDVSFEVAKGEVVGFLGPNGAGKTTAMRILTGYLPASSGTVRVAGFDVLRESLEVRRRIGYLPESVPLYREHRVVEMLEFQARLHAIPRRERASRIDEALEQVGLTDRRRDLVGNLSRGLRQRAGLAVALLPRPEVLILDEPTSGLDPMQRLEVRGLIQALRDRHTVLLSSHILPEIEAVCPRVVIVHKGRIAADGTPAELVAKLAGASHIRLEAVVGADPAVALRMLRSIRGVRDVVDHGRLGIHHQFDLACDEDLREDVGAIAASRGWALRELSWRRPTLEQIFARIATGASDEVEKPARAPAPAGDPASVPIALGGLPPASAATAHASSAPASTASAPATRVVYNLNPFDRGATRSLSVPKVVEDPNAPPPSTADTGPNAGGAPRP